MSRPLVGGVCVGLMLAAGSWAPVQAQTPAESQAPGAADRMDYEPARQSSVRMVRKTGAPRADTWRGGMAAGFLADSPDDAAMALSADMDYGINESVSVGPLAQAAFTGDMFLLGLSGGAKYWLPIADEARLVFQGGLGFVHADFARDDTSWLIPLGVGYDYTLSSGTHMTATVLVNFTDLEAGGNTDVMPAILLGLRF